jgi:hypothetical protein
MVQVFLLCVRINYDTKTISVDGPVFWPSGDIEADIEQMKVFYKDGVGKHPEKMGLMQLKQSGLQNLSQRQVEE